MAEISTDKSLLPQHIAIIMDGNGRWAQEQGKHRSEGHAAGVESVRCLTATCVHLGIPYLTLYAFSTENWRRPLDEVQALMSLVVAALDDKLFMENNVRFQMIGDRQRLPRIVRRKVEQMERKTASNSAMTMTIALSYSARWEITAAVKAICAEVAAGALAVDNIDEAVVSQHLATVGLPDPDLLIRTSGEQRVSNYLLWQIAYSELYFCDTYWPAFRDADLFAAIAWYQSRQRRYGHTPEQVATSSNSSELCADK